MKQVTSRRRALGAFVVSVAASLLSLPASASAAMPTFTIAGSDPGQKIYVVAECPASSQIIHNGVPVQLTAETPGTRWTSWDTPAAPSDTFTCRPYTRSAGGALTYEDAPPARRLDDAGVSLYAAARAQARSALLDPANARFLRDDFDVNGAKVGGLLCNKSAAGPGTVGELPQVFGYWEGGMGIQAPDAMTRGLRELVALGAGGEAANVSVRAIARTSGVELASQTQPFDPLPLLQSGHGRRFFCRVTISAPTLGIDAHIVDGADYVSDADTRAHELVKPTYVNSMPGTLTCPVQPGIAEAATRTMVVVTRNSDFVALPARYNDSRVALGRSIVMAAYLVYPRRFEVASMTWVSPGEPFTPPAAARVTRGKNATASVHCIDVYTSEGPVDEAASAGVLHHVLGAAPRRVSAPAYRANCLVYGAPTAPAGGNWCALPRPDSEFGLALERLQGNVSLPWSSPMPAHTRMTHTSTTRVATTSHCMWDYNSDVQVFTRHAGGSDAGIACGRSMGGKVVRRVLAKVTLPKPRVTCSGSPRGSTCAVSAFVAKLMSLPAAEGQVQVKEDGAWRRGRSLYLPTLGKQVSRTTQALPAGAYRVRLFAPATQLSKAGASRWTYFTVGARR